MTITDKIVDLIDHQVEMDRTYGAVGIEEASAPEFLPDQEKAAKLDEDGRARIVAIATIIDALQEEAEDILNGL